MDLIQKNQKIAEDLDLKLRAKDQELETQLTSKSSQSNAQTKYLESENKILKEIQEKKMTSERERIEFHKTLRNLLLEEIERVEKGFEEKQQQLVLQKENQRSDFEAEQDAMNQTINELSQTLNETQSTMGDSQREWDAEKEKLTNDINYLTNQNRDLSVKVGEQSKELSVIQDHLNSTQVSSHMDETKWTTEKNELLDSVAKTVSLAEEKDNLKDHKIKTLEDGYKTTVEVQDRRIRNFQEERKTLTSHFTESQGALKSKYELAESELQEVLQNNLKLVRIFEERESLMNKEVLQMRTEISALQKTYDTRETKFIEESTSYADNVETLHTLIEKAEERLEEGWDPQRSVSETLRFQVENLEL